MYVEKVIFEKFLFSPIFPHENQMLFKGYPQIMNILWIIIYVRKNVDKYVYNLKNFFVI